MKAPTAPLSDIITRSRTTDRESIKSRHTPDREEINITHRRTDKDRRTPEMKETDRDKRTEEHMTWRRQTDIDGQKKTRH